MTEEPLSDYARFKQLPSAERDRLGFEKWLAAQRREKRPRLRDLQPGDLFTLLRTDTSYSLLRHENKTPGGARCIVMINGGDEKARETSLHPSCLVRLEHRRTTP